MCTAVLLAVLFSGHLYAQDVIPAGVKCTECGMAVDPSSKFSSWVINSRGERSFFCDIGDMLKHIRDDIKDVRSINVRDYTTGQWIDGKKAFYVYIEGIKTPMSWGIAAFRDEADAKSFGTPVRFNDAFRLLR
ncbi:MAG: hypothetical protein OHK0032_01410 [Thermodesulfovibrionales bacterium]